MCSSHLSRIKQNFDKYRSKIKCLMCAFSLNNSWGNSICTIVILLLNTVPSIPYTLFVKVGNFPTFIHLYISHVCLAVYY